jgi:hypothetical protein
MYSILNSRVNGTLRIVKSSIADPVPGSGAFFDIPDYISESLEIISWVNIFNSLMLMQIRIWNPGIFLTLDPGSGMEKIRTRDPQHW